MLKRTNQSGLLCISTSKRVLHTPFAGRNQFFDAIRLFFITNEIKERKKKAKLHKNMQKHAFSSGVDQILGVNQCLRVTPLNNMSFCYFLGHFSAVK